MSKLIPVFRPWVPEWAIRFALLLVVLPGLILFVLSISNVNAAAGYYGISPNDVQYSCIIFYSAMASFVVLEGRFFKYIASKEYFIICVLLLMGTCYLCYLIRSFTLLLIVRYIQGLLTCGTLSITLTLMFSRLHSERAREIGYSVVYCILLSAIPFSTAVTSPIIDAFNFNVLYKVALYSYLPGAVLMFIFMNNIRFNRKLPLYQLDWPSFLIYTTGFSLAGYLAVYGQQYDWFDDGRILSAALLVAVLVVVFIVRQRSSKRPYIYLQAFKNRNFVLGAVLLYILYIARGAFGITTSFMGTVLGLDPIHIGYLMLYNIIAIVIAVLISSRLMLRKTPIRLILIYGFTTLLVFHVLMCFIFTSQADESDLIIPVVLQGLGVGMLMAPIILFLVSSAPAKYGNTGSAVGIFIRFSGFCSSIALTNYFQLYRQNEHMNRFQEQLSGLNPVAEQKLSLLKQGMIGKGIAPDQATKIANVLFNKSVSLQAQLRFAMDYYQLISWLLLSLLLVIILFPSISRTLINLRTKQPAPIVY